MTLAPIYITTHCLNTSTNNSRQIYTNFRLVFTTVQRILSNISVGCVLALCSNGSISLLIALVFHSPFPFYNDTHFM